MTNPRTLFTLLGWISLALGVIGAFLPLLPTTPFVLLAAYCFSKGSQRWHQWLLQSQRFGPLIRDWNHHGVIRLSTKCTATALMAFLGAYALIYVNVSDSIKILVTLIQLSVLVFIWSRPSKPQQN